MTQRRRAIAVAGEPLRGADLVVFPELVLVGYPPEDLVLRPALVEAATAALESLRVESRFAVEPLNRFETDILNTARQGVELMKRVAHPAVGLMLDTFHMNIEEKDVRTDTMRASGVLPSLAASCSLTGSATTFLVR